MSDKFTHRLYGDLSWLWPYWGDPAGSYAEWGNLVVDLINKHAKCKPKTLLNIGCGGGKNIFNLKNHFKVTGLDINPVMLKQARELNPGCEYVKADMRHFSLKEKFDAILIDDAISYMTNENELLSVFRCASAHLKPGGILIVSPDELKETFQQGKTEVSHPEQSITGQNLNIVFIENYYDPDDSDTIYEGTFIYLIRENGMLRVETDRHVFGLFDKQTWHRIISLAELALVDEFQAPEIHQVPVFICRKD